jgi:Tfp pilus assembly protein PilW
MCDIDHEPRRQNGHTLTELVVAMVASSFLLAGLGSVMLIARQVALTPSAAERRASSAQVVNTMAGELRFATLMLQQSSRILEFVTADRNADGAAERIKYEWSGIADAPLYKTVNGGASAIVLESVRQFQLDYSLTSKVTTLQPTVESAEAALLTTTVGTASLENLNATNWLSQEIDPQYFAASIGAINRSAATTWNATRVVFSSASATALAVELRETGSLNGPSNQLLGRVSLTSANVNEAAFPNGVKGLLLSRKYAVVFRPDSTSTVSIASRTLSPVRVLHRSSDSGASWSMYPDRLVSGTLYGTYSTLGTPVNVTRNYVSHVRIALQSGEASHARIDASIPLSNLPELLAAYWRADFDSNPTTSNGNGDSTADWAQTTGTFDPATLASGIWRPTNSLETRPFYDFTNVTTIDVRCQNTSVGGNGAVMRINADRQGGQFAPLFVCVQLQSDGTQTLTLYGKSSDTNMTPLFTRSRLSSDPVRYQLMILPQNNVVNLRINDDDQGTYSYPTHAPLSTTNRYLTLFEDTSQAEFDYVEVRVSSP